MSEFKIMGGICMVTVQFLCMNGCAKSENVPPQTEKVEWGYEAENGPDVWGQLSPEYVLCAEGTRQSPIDLVNPTSAKLPAIVFNYQPTALNIRNNGHTIEVASTEENWVEVDGTRYELLQSHFHAPSEHTMAGKPFDMEMHLVHKNEDGTLAVIGVLIEQGGDHAAFNPLWAHLPSAPGEVKRIENVTINAADLLPSTRHAYRYDGSLTTPPCSEGVKWFVLTAPIELSELQIAAFEAIFHDNNRPIQPMNGRELLVDIAEDD
jgi:carbonic anhydrase